MIEINQVSNGWTYAVYNAKHQPLVFGWTRDRETAEREAAMESPVELEISIVPVTEKVHASTD